MNPYLMEQLTNERLREVRQGTPRRKPGRVRPRGTRHSARQRAGGALVEVGLRLAGTPGA